MSGPGTSTGPKGQAANSDWFDEILRVAAWVAIVVLAWGVSTIDRETLLFDGSLRESMTGLMGSVSDAVSRLAYVLRSS